MQLNAERLPRISTPKTPEPTESTYANKERQRRYSWSWNVPLLIASIAIVAVTGCTLTGLYFWQSKRLSSEMLRRATVAAQAEDYQEQVKWLTRYVRLAPKNIQAQIELATATDNAVETHLDLHAARTRLSAAIAATGEQSAFQTQRTELRRRLIKRLLQLGGVWAAEAERQILFLSEPPEDAQALSWLAKAMASQRLAKIRGDAKAVKSIESTDYWKQLTEQPVGLVLRKALEHNPSDLELALLFLNALSENPKWFEGSDDSPSHEQLKREAENLCRRLIAMQDSGRAQWLVYAYQLKQEREAADALLETALPGALERLAKYERTAENQEQNTKTESALTDVKAVPLADENAYQPFWDWQLALAAGAQATTESRLAEAQAIYERLLPLASPAISRPQREATYLAAGQAYLSAKKVEKAIEVWTTGAEALKGSIDLSGALLMALTDLGQIEDAERVLKDLDGYVKQQFAYLDGVQGSGLSLAEKQEVRQRLELARWKSDVFGSQLQMQRGQFREAAERLAKAFNSPLSIDADSRIRSGRLLSECYGKLQLWDLAGQTLDRCVTFQPTDITLRRLAAEAWRRLGAPERASSQIESLDDGSFGAALEIARLKATAEAFRSPEERDLQSVRASIQVAKLRLEALPEAERALQPTWLLEILEIALAEPSATDQEPSHARIEALAAKYATNPDVQLSALTNLVSQKKIEPAKLILKRLEKIAEVSGKPEDVSNTIMAKALLAEAGDDIDAALVIVRKGITEAPKDALRLAKMGAAMAKANKQNATAYEMLKLVGEESWDVDALMSAGQLGLTGESTNGAAISDSDLQRWEEKLRRLEGESGCNWRYMTAKRLLDRAVRSPERAKLLAEAQKLFAEIDRLRPRWGIGAALGGQIAALQGSHDTAVSLLRRAMRDGDTQVSTILSLVAELTATAHFEEAEQELKRLADLPQSVFPTSMWEISLAQKKGDLKAALDLARKSTSRNRNDANSWLVASQTALAVSRSKTTATAEKAQLRAEAWDALERAASLTGGKDLNVWNARFQFHLEAGDKDQALKELAALQASPLPASASLLAAANGFLALQDFETAQARAKEAMALAPDAAQPHAVMARIRERMGDRQGMLSDLQDAHRLDSENNEIRERLAVAYVLASDEVPWPEVDRLLTDNAALASAKSPLLRAMLSLERGDEQRVATAIKELTVIAESTDAQAAVAKRLLARQYTKQWLKADRDQRETPAGRKNFEQASDLYNQLLNTETPAPADGVTFAHLLIEAERLDEAKRIADKFSATVTSPLILRLRLKIAQLQGEDLSTVASSWIATASGFEDDELWVEVGKTLSEMELHDDALTWLEKAYRANPAKFKSYAVGLAKAGQTGRAIDLCVSLIQQEGNLEAATLLPQIVLLNPAEQQSEPVEQALAGAIKKHADSAPLLEAVATLRLMQERYAESVALYEQSEKLAPNRPQTLNNLAIALAELPTRKNTALEKINKAIQLYGRHPQFLDTLAIVQSQLGEHDKAKATLEEALSAEKDPRFQMRLVEELIALGEQTQAEDVWGQIELERLKAMALTPAEQRSFTKLSKELASQ